jgi:hypothetical protein
VQGRGHLGDLAAPFLFAASNQRPADLGARGEGTLRLTAAHIDSQDRGDHEQRAKKARPTTDCRVQSVEVRNATASIANFTEP